MYGRECYWSRIAVTSLVRKMLLMTMMLAAIRLSDVIDPCHPPVPCVANSNMSDPHGDCSVYYVCQSSRLLWQRMQCEMENNETTHYDLSTGLCLVSSLQPTCHNHCPGQWLLCSFLRHSYAIITSYSQCCFCFYVSSAVKCSGFPLIRRSLHPCVRPESLRARYFINRLGDFTKLV